MESTYRISWESSGADFILELSSGSADMSHGARAVQLGADQDAETASFREENTSQILSELVLTDVRGDRQMFAAQSVRDCTWRKSTVGPPD